MAAPMAVQDAISAGGRAGGATSEEGARRAEDERATRRVVLTALAVWAVTRVAFVAVTYFTFTLLPHSPRTGSVAVSPHTMLEGWSRSDVIWYGNIASLGYWRPQASAFFPLFPLLMRGASLVLGHHWTLAAMIVANGGTLLAFVGLALLAYHETRDGATAMRCLWALAVYPLAVFLFAGYGDGLFFGLVAFALLFARQGRWWWAGGVAFLAGLARPTGLALVLPLAWEYGRQHGWWSRAAWRAGAWRARFKRRELAELVVAVGAVPAAVLGYMGFLWLRFGDPLIFLREENANWHHTTWPIWRTAIEVARQVWHTPPWTYWQAHQLIDLVPLLAFAAITALMARRLPGMYTLYMAGVIYLSIASPIPIGYPNLLMSVGRYMLAAVPMFLVLGRWMRGRQGIESAMVALGFALQGVLTMVFITGGWLI